MKKKVLFVSTTRADFSYFFPILNEIYKDSQIESKLLITGYHFLENNVENIIKSTKINCIELNPFEKNKDKNSMLMSSTMLYKLSKLDFNPDIVFLLGDRHELLPIAYYAYMVNAIIGHIGGGEGNISMCLDSEIRNAITKLSHLHFVSHEVYKQRLLNMGEAEDRVFLVGNVSHHNDSNVSSNIFFQFLKNNKIDQNKNGFVHFCFHPVTNVNDFGEKELLLLLDVVKEYSQFTYICTGINFDPGSGNLKNIINSFEQNNKNFICFNTLGKDNYYSFLSCCKFMIGNSSSGVIETIKYNLPTINFGQRQNGRLFTDNVYNVSTREQVVDSINDILNSDKKTYENSLYRPDGINIIIDTIKNVDVEKAKIKTFNEKLSKNIKVCDN